MKIGLFSDPHYCHLEDVGGGRKPLASYNKIKEAMESFKAQGVDLCFCLGDLVDCPQGTTKEECKKNLRDIMSLINSYGIPFYLVHGNHDFLGLSEKDFEMENIHTPPYIIDKNECKFIVLDSNYRSNMEHFSTAGVVWDDANLPPFQVEYLRNALEKSDKDCVVLVHENLDPGVQYQHIIKNAEEIRNIISASGKVKLVIQGHFHEGSYTGIDGVPYLTLEAMCQGEQNPYTVIEI